MPYIPHKDRVALNHQYEHPRTPGQLNYVLTDAVLMYCSGSVDYQKINDVIGALECAKLEFYRRVAIPYENKKIAENGDVY